MNTHFTLGFLTLNFVVLQQNPNLKTFFSNLEQLAIMQTVDLQLELHQQVLMLKVMLSPSMQNMDSIFILNCIKQLL